MIIDAALGGCLVVLVALWVGDRRRVAELSSSQQLVETAADVIPVGIFRSDADGTFRFANRRLIEILGQDPCNGPISDVFHIDPADLKDVRRAWERANRMKTPFAARYRIIVAGGQT